MDIHIVIASHGNIFRDLWWAASSKKRTLKFRALILVNPFSKITTAGLCAECPARHLRLAIRPKWLAVAGRAGASPSRSSSVLVHPFLRNFSGSFSSFSRLSDELGEILVAALMHPTPFPGNRVAAGSCGDPIFGQMSSLVKVRGGWDLAFRSERLGFKSRWKPSRERYSLKNWIVNYCWLLSLAITLEPQMPWEVIPSCWKQHTFNLYLASNLGPCPKRPILEISFRAIILQKPRKEKCEILAGRPLGWTSAWGKSRWMLQHSGSDCAPEKNSFSLRNNSGNFGAIEKLVEKNFDVQGIKTKCFPPNDAFLGEA